MIFKMNNKKKADNWTRTVYKASIVLVLAIGGYILLPTIKNYIRFKFISLDKANTNNVNTNNEEAETKYKAKAKVQIYKYLDLTMILPPTGSFLTSLAIPRVSGSEGNLKVRSFIKSKFSQDFWDIEEDEHVIDSLHGASTLFVNLIFTFKKRHNLNKNDRKYDKKRTILAAHYDSKLLEAETGTLSIPVSTLKSEFIGASDSAWSCALLIALAQAISLEAEQGKEFNRDALDLQILFFDGEEAVRQWSSTDSLYGSRALAQKWSQLPPSHPNSLSNISVFILLDLLGTLDGKDIFSFHPDGTEMAKLFEQFLRIESKLPLHIFKTSGQFKNFNGQVIEDDHTPFLTHNVPVLHLIPIPFPKVWHTLQDTLQALDPQVCEHLAIVIYEFVRQRFMASHNLYL